MPTIGLVANVYNEVNALPGWLETHLPFFDDVRVLHAGPQGAYSDDGTIELLQKWRVPTEFCAIDQGFGVVRTMAVRMSPCDWVVVLDADERFYPRLNVMTCEGESTPAATVDSLLYDYGNPNFAKDGPRNPQVVQSYDRSIDFTACPSNFENMAMLGANLRVRPCGRVFDQGAWLREITMDESLDAVRTIRRHWHDFSNRRPTQNWHTDPDFQVRVVRNRPGIYWDSAKRMHEGLVGVQSVYTPDHTQGPFFDHYHIFFKKQEIAQRLHDVSIYNAINEGKIPPVRTQ